MTFQSASVQRPLRQASTSPEKASLQLLGGMSADQFMKKYWQKKPVCIRAAFTGNGGWPTRQELMELAEREDVESRLISSFEGQWKLKHGPLPRKSLPALKRSHWTFLVQGVNLHHAGAHELMQRFRFIPDARLDDIMISWATDQAGVGPHFDSYDVFLIQATGKRLWRIGRQKGDRSLVPGLPVRILANFEAEEEFLLEAGDMLYLPPGWAHDGIAVGSDCMTVSVGFRVPKRADVATELAGRMADAYEDDTLYRDPQQQATQEPSRIPDELIEFAHESLLRMATDTDSMMCALGEWLTEPKPQVWFEGKGGVIGSAGIELDAKSNMQYSSPWLFINGESFEVAGKDEKLLQQLANQRQLPLNVVKKLSSGASEVLQDWLDQGWLHLVAK